MSKRELASREFTNLMDKYFAYDDFHLGVFPLMPRAKYRKDVVLNDAWNEFEARLLDLILKQIPPEYPTEL
jgi:hypothetical protein